MKVKKNLFTYLDDHSVKYVENDDNARQAYLDLLTYLHEEVSRKTASHVETPMDPTHTERGIAELKHHFSSNLQIGQAARRNIQAADLVTGPFACSFLEDLMKEYDKLRVIRSKAGSFR